MEAKSVILAMTIIISFANTFGASVNVDFGSCITGKESCRDCYLTLKQELLKRDDNVFNLSRAFFPPETNPPEFVKVTYKFVADNGEIDDSNTQVWYWVGQSSYLFYPPITFQFLSLFFGKPEEYYTQEVTVTLNATNCLGVIKDHMTLLTQRLKAFIQRNTFNPILDNTYTAKSGQNLNDILDGIQSKYTTGIIYFYQVFLLTIILIFISVIPFISNYYHKWYNKLTEVTVNKNKKKSEALLASVAVISAILTVYVIILDCFVIKYNYRDDLVQTIVSSDLNHMPSVVFAFDVGFIIVYTLFLCVFRLYKQYKCKCCEETCWKCTFTKSEECSCRIISYDFALAITFSNIAIIINHSPFIAISFINDAYHAGSIFVFYLFSHLILLSVIEVTFYTILSNIYTIEYTDIQVTLNGSCLTLLEQNIVVNGTTEERKESYGNQGDPSDAFVVTKMETKLEFDKATLKNVPLSGKITMRFNRVEKGKLTDVCLKFPSDYLQQFKQQCQRKQLFNEQEFNITLKLILNKKKQILTTAKCTYESLQLHNEKLIIKEVELVKDNIAKVPCIWSIFSTIFLSTLTLLVIVFTATYLVLIPINRSISDAPNRLIAIYQTIILLVGVYIGYKTFFKKKISLESVVGNSVKSLSSDDKIDDNRWSLMSKEERLAEFYRTEAEMIKLRANSLRQTS